MGGYKSQSLGIEQEQSFDNHQHIVISNTNINQISPKLNNMVLSVNELDQNNFLLLMNK